MIFSIMYPKTVKNLLCLLLMLCTLTFTACTSSDDSENLNTMTIKLISDKDNVDFTSFTVTAIESRSATKFTATPDASGTVVFSLPLGQYNITAEDLVNGASTMYGHVDDFTLSSTNTSCSIPLKDLQLSMEKTFVLDELFFNCSSNGDWDNNYYEEYFTIRNVSNRPLYADGLSFAIAGDYNCTEDDGIKSSRLDHDSIVVSQLYTIPGNGRDHLVQPGESLVIAHSAIDHTQNGTKPSARDLSGADFEVYVPYEYSMTTDNPEVPNLIVNYSMFQAFSWGYGGYAPIMLLRTGNTDLTTYVKNNLRNMKVTGSWGNQMQDYLVIPTSWIIDGVETASVDNMFHKVLPANVDKGVIYIQDTGMYGGFQNQFVQRRPTSNGYVQDTNNSENDFVVVPNGQKNYSKK